MIPESSLPVGVVPYVICHCDADGYASAAAIRHKYPNAILIVSNHGHGFPVERIPFGSTVFIVDYSYAVSVMIDLSKNYNIIWIDHHSKAIKAAIEKDYNPPGNRSVDHSACILTWQYCFPNTPVPLGYTLVDDYDRWQFKYEDTLAFQYGMNTQQLYPVRGTDVWPDVINDTDGSFVNSIISIGKPIHEFICARNAIVAKDIAFTVHMGLKIPDPTSKTGQTKSVTYQITAANVRGVDSLLFKSLANLESSDALLIYGYIPSLQKWRYSIYDNGRGVDVGAIAQANGGNGHEFAAGWLQDNIEIYPEVTGTPSFDDPLAELLQQYVAVPLVRKYLLKSESITVNSQMQFVKCFGLKAVVCNTPYTWPDIWYNVDTANAQIGIGFVMTNTGRYRLVISNLGGMSVDMNKLATDIGGTLMPNGTVWKYYDRDVWPCYEKYDSGIVLIDTKY